MLLNALRSAAVRRHWGTGKLEARPDQELRRPLASALHQAVRELGHPRPDDADHVLGVIRAFAQRDAGPGARLKDRWNPGIEAPVVRGRADSGDIEIDLVELLTDVGGLAADVGRGVAVFVDEMQDLGPDDVSALCAACHEISQSGLPLIVVGAGLPHLPAVLSASKSYSERLFALPAHRPAAARGGRPGADRSGRGGGRALGRGRAGRDVRRDRWLPVLHPGLRQGGLGPRHRLADHRGRRRGRRRRRPRPSWPSGSSARRYDRATPGEREYLRAMADVAAADAAALGDSVPTADVAAALGKKPQSLSPARDSLLKKGLIYSAERGRIAFTVPHFGRYLRDHA